MSVFFTSGLELAQQLQEGRIEVFRPAPFEPGHFTVDTLSQIRFLTHARTSMHTRTRTHARTHACTPARSPAGSHARTHSRSLRHSGIRIVLTMAHDADVQAVALRADSMEMTSGWSWTLPGICTACADTSLQGWLYLRPVLPKGMQAFAEQVSNYARSSFNITIDANSVDLTFSAALYDAVMLYARAVTKVVSEGGNVYDGRAVTAAVRSMTFEGVGGTKAFDEHGDPIESYEVMTYVLKVRDVMSSVAVGVYNSSVGQYKAYEREVLWPGKTTEVPVDYFLGAPRWTTSVVDFDWALLQQLVLS